MNLRWNGAAVILSVIVVPSSSNAFVSPIHSDFSSSLFMGPPSDLVSAPDTDFGEGSRKNRRTVYTHDQWVKHRSSDRFINNLKTLPNSDIYKQVGPSVFLTTSIAISVCVWNALVGGYQDFGGVMHDPVIAERWAVKVGMPMTPFTVLNSSLGLLLGELYINDYKCTHMFISHVVLTLLHLCMWIAYMTEHEHTTQQCFVPTHLTNVGMRHESSGVSTLITHVILIEWPRHGMGMNLSLTVQSSWERVPLLLIRPSLIQRSVNTFLVKYLS